MVREGIKHERHTTGAEARTTHHHSAGGDEFGQLIDVGTRGLSPTDVAQGTPQCAVLKANAETQPIAQATTERKERMNDTWTKAAAARSRGDNALADELALRALAADEGEKALAELDRRLRNLESPATSGRSRAPRPYAERRDARAAGATARRVDSVEAYLRASSNDQA